MARFEIVSYYEGEGINLPKRSTAHSAGHDICAAEDTLIKAYQGTDSTAGDGILSYPLALIPTGLKIKLDENQFVQLVPRSSLYRKTGLLFSNSPGIIDADYYGNPDNGSSTSTSLGQIWLMRDRDNGGHVFVGVWNLGREGVVGKKGDRIAQAIIMSYGITEDDNATGERLGGFGSTGN